MSIKLRKLVFFILITQLVFNSVIYYSIPFFLESENLFYFYNLYSVISFILIYFLIFKIGGLFSIHSITTLFIFIFLYGRSMLYVFDPEVSFFDSEIISLEYIGYQNMFKALLISNIFIFSINSVYVLFGKPDKIQLMIDDSSKKVEFYIFSLIIFSSFLYAIKLFLEYKYILSAGYISLYVGGLKNVNYYSPLIKYSHIFFMSFFSYYLIVVSKRKQFFIIASVFLVLSFLDSLKGARISLILPIVFLVWYYNCVFKINLNFKFILKGFVIFLFIVTYSISTSLKRNDLEVDLGINVFKTAIFETGSTLQTVGRYIKHKDVLDPPYPFFLEPIIFPLFYFTNFMVMTNGQSEEMLEYRNSLNHKLTYFISTDAYLEGRGVGSSTPAEFYQYGLIPLISFSIVYGLIMIWFYKLISNKFIIFLSITLVSHIFFIARDSPFPNFLILIKGAFIYLILKFIFSIVSVKSIN